MPITGRPPKPTALRKLQGNPGHRPLNESEPIPEGEIGYAPRWLNAAAKREWKKMVKVLGPTGILTKSDEVPLALLCSYYVQFIEVTTRLMEIGHDNPLGRGRSSLSLAQDSLAGKILDLSGRFGLTPSDRARLHVPEKAKEDPFEEFLSKKKKASKPKPDPEGSTEEEGFNRDLAELFQRSEGESAKDN